MYPGLSADQAPPLSIPFRFFLTAPLFGIAAAVLLAVDGPVLLASRWLPVTLAATHVLLLGFVVMVAMGALPQVLPIVASVPFPAARVVGPAAHVTWTLGVIALAWGLARGPVVLAVAGGAALTGAAAVLVAALALGLARTSVRSDSVTALRLSVASFAVAVGLGATLALGHAGWTPHGRPHLTDLHLAWALVGWITLLVVGVAYQVVPMFQTTAPYPALLRRVLAPAVFAVLGARSAVALAGAGLGAGQGPGQETVRWLALGLEVVGGALLVWFAVATLRLQVQGKRRVPDATVRLFALAMVSLVVAVVAHLGHRVLGVGVGRLDLVAGLAFVVGFATSVVVGMLLKVVPFLTWFHLQAEAGRRFAKGGGLTPVPMMKDVIGDRPALAQAWLHGLACVLVVSAPARPALVAPAAGVALAASFALLAVTLGRATWVLVRSRSAA